MGESDQMIMERKFMENYGKIEKRKTKKGITIIRIHYDVKNGKNIRNQMIRFGSNLIK